MNLTREQALAWLTLEGWYYVASGTDPCLGWHGFMNDAQERCWLYATDASNAVFKGTYIPGIRKQDVPERVDMNRVIARVLS